MSSNVIAYASPKPTRFPCQGCGDGFFTQCLCQFDDKPWLSGEFSHIENNSV